MKSGCRFALIEHQAVPKRQNSWGQTGPLEKFSPASCSETDSGCENSLEKLCGCYWPAGPSAGMQQVIYRPEEPIFKGGKKKITFICSIYSWIIHHDSSNPWDWAWMKSNDLNCSTSHLLHSTCCSNWVPSSAQLPGSGAYQPKPFSKKAQKTPGQQPGLIVVWKSGYNSEQVACLWTQASWSKAELN